MIHSVEMMARKSQRNGAAGKREAILRAATRVFARNGYFNSKVADIAAAAGVADGTVYLYFKSKEEILHSIFDQNMAEAIGAARKLTEKLSDPREKLLVFSDALDVPTIEKAYHHFDGKVRLSFGWGTNLTNDFVGCAPDGSVDLDPISIVCKVTSVDGRPAVKLSDNPEKATGDLSEVERYLRVFGNAGRVRTAVHV